MIKAFKPVVFSNSKIILLGTMPSEKSIEKQEYYANPNNKFWSLLFDIFNSEPIKNYTARLKFIKQHHLALWDVLAFCERFGSLDSSIKNEEANNFDAFFMEYPNIECIIFTSKNAYNLYNKHIGHFYNKAHIILPSSSGAYAAISYQVKLTQWTKIKEVYESFTK